MSPPPHPSPPPRSYPAEVAAGPGQLEQRLEASGHPGEQPPPAERYLWMLGALVLASFVLRMFWLTRPDGALIFDEKYYVNAARMLAGISPGQGMYPDKALGLDPNTEHPPLAKLLVAGSILLFGDNAFAWRILSVFFGTASIPLLYGIARRVGAGSALALLAAALLAFDNLMFVHSRIFTLDIFQLTFMLLGLYWYLGGHPIPAGVGFALAAMCKIGGMFGIGAIVVYEALRLMRGPCPPRAVWRPVAGRIVLLGFTFAVVFVLLLGFTDRVWVGYRQPLEHVRHIFTYATILRRPAGPSGIESYPWQWLWNETQIPYIRVEQQVKVGDEVRENRPIVLFLGAMNPFVLQLWPLGLGFAAYAWWWRRPGADIGTLALAWFVCTYLPFLGASVLGQRISYLFYFMPTLPAVVLAGSYFLLGTGLPRFVIAVYLAAVLLGFYGYFPFKPVQ